MEVLKVKPITTNMLWSVAFWAFNSHLIYGLYIQELLDGFMKYK